LYSTQAYCENNPYSTILLCTLSQNYDKPGENLQEQNSDKIHPDDNQLGTHVDSGYKLDTMEQCISMCTHCTRNHITMPIYCMYISDTIWVQCIRMRTQNCINMVILFLYTFHTIWVRFTQCGYF